jgi:hypothetical protein
MSLPSSFSIFPRSFLTVSLSHFATSIRLFLSAHSTFCTFFPLLPSNTCFLSPGSHIWISPPFFSLLHSLSPGTPEFPLSYTSHSPCCILYLESRFFDSLPYFLLVDVFDPFTQLYIHSSSFCSQSFHFFTGIPVPLVVLLPLSPCPFSFLSSIPSVSCTLPFHPFCPQLCRSLFRFHSQPIPLTLFPHYVTWCFSVHS